MKVQEGQVLARIDDTNVKTSLRLAEAQLVSATNALAETRVRIREADQELERQCRPGEEQDRDPGRLRSRGSDGPRLQRRDSNSSRPM
jgi:multidrug resistance efflux pump